MEKRKNKHKYSTYTIIGILVFVLMTAAFSYFDSEDLDEICQTNDAILYRDNGEWGCGTIVIPESNASEWKKVGTNITPTTTGTDVLLPDNDLLKFGTGGLSGNLGTDAQLFSNGTNVLLKIESPLGVAFEPTATNPSLVLKNYDIFNNYAGSFSSYVFTFSATNNIGLWNAGRYLFVADPTRSDDGIIFIPSKSYNFINDLYGGSFIYNSVNNNLRIISSGSGSNIQLSPHTGSGTKGHTFTNSALKIQSDTYGLELGAGNDTKIYWDGNDYITNTTTGNFLIKNNTGWGTIEYGRAIEHTTNSTLSDPLSAFDSVSSISPCKVQTIETDYSRPVYTPVKHAIERQFNIPIQYLENDGYNETHYWTIEQVATYPYTRLIEGTDNSCEKAEMRGALKQLNEGMDIIKVAERTLIDADIISAEAIYTESKVPQPNVNYMDAFKIEDLDSKEEHYAVELISSKQRLDMEKRIVYLEGAIAQLSVELCSESNNKYTWCEK